MAAAAALFLLPTLPALAQTEPPGLWQRSTLLGDIGGLRPALADAGITLGLVSTLEAFANATGGAKRGASGDGLTTLTATLDTEKAFGWEGGTFNASALAIAGPNFGARTLQALQTTSGIAARPGLRLWELWYQQAFLAGRMDLRIGQQSIDQEFVTSQQSNLFVNTAAGWPALPSVDLYAGGPAYPLSSLGIRLRARPADGLTLLAGVFNDNPPGGPFDDDDQVRGAERHGVRFNLNTGALFIAELQVAINQPPAGADAKPAAAGLPGTYKLGIWFDTAKFSDQRFDAAGRSLADPAGTGNPRLHWHNYSLYAVADQTIWQPGGDDPRALGVFLRPMAAPGDRNQVDFSVHGGVTLKAPLPGRDDDTFGVSFGVANVSARAAALARDAAFFAHAYVPTRGPETFLEVTYQMQVTPWWQVQPDFQYYWMPGGGTPDPTNPTRRIGNAAVFGIRTNVTF